jgi:hypothetical protein
MQGIPCPKITSFPEWTVLWGISGSRKNLTYNRFFSLSEAVKFAELKLESGFCFIRISNRKFDK